MWSGATARRRAYPLRERGVWCAEFRVGILCVLAFLSLGRVAQALELRGFPVKLGDGVGASSATAADIDGDGNTDLVLCTTHKLVVLQNSGAPLLGFPFELAPAGEQDDLRQDASPTVCDLDADGTLEIIVAGADKRLHVVGRDGQERDGWPVKLSARAPGAATCADVNGDKRLDVVVAASDGSLAAFSQDGTRLSAFRKLRSKVAAMPMTVVDLRPDRAGQELLIATTEGEVLAFDARGRRIKNFSLKTDFAISAPVAAGDLDRDGRWDVVVGSQDFKVHAVDARGQALPGFPVETGYRIYGGVALGDIDRDGLVDVLVGGGDGEIYAFSAQGKPLRGWPVKTKGRIHSTPALADLTRNGKLEVVVTSTDGRLYVLDGRGRSLPGYPVHIGGELTTSPLIVDLDGNETLEVVVASARGLLHAYAFVPEGKVSVATVAWAGYGHDAARRGRTWPNPAFFVDLKIEPEQPKTGDPLVAHYRYSDLDGDLEKGTRVRWIRNGQRVKALDGAREVPAEQTRKGQRWRFTLQGGDDYKRYGSGPGAHRMRSPEIRIANTAPLAAVVALQKVHPQTRDALVLKISKPAQDADGDKIRYKVRWLQDHRPIKALNGVRTVAAKQTRKGQVWEVVVIPDDGTSAGPPARIETVIENTPPSAPSIALGPSPLRVAQNVKVTIKKPARDADGDPLQYRYRWLVDGHERPLASTVASAPGAIAHKGQVIAVEVRADDGSDLGEAARAEVKVVNTAPPPAVLTLAPKLPSTRDDILVRISAHQADADGDSVNYDLRWSVDGKFVEGEAAPRFPALKTAKGQRIKVTAVARDGVGTAAPVSASVVVGNLPPGPPRVSISPQSPRAGDALKAQVIEPAVDPDGDKVRYLWSWLRDGQVVEGLTIDSVPAGRVQKKQVWRVKVVASDGSATGEAGWADVRIEDTPPEASAVALRPARPRTIDDLRVEISQPARDVDGDKVRYRYHWFVDGVAQDFAEDADRVPASHTRKGQVWRVEIVSVADGVVGAQSEVSCTIEDSSPARPELVIAPAEPRTGDRLVASVPELPADVDGDAIEIRIHWLRDGKDAALQGPVVPANATRKGQTWTVVAVASDGSKVSEAGKASVVIANTSPVPPLLEVAQRAYRTDQEIEVKLRAPATDVDGDPLTTKFRWEVDGRQVPAFDEPLRLRAAQTKKGQRWVLHATSSDGQIESETRSLAVDIINTPPGVPAITLLPSAPDTNSPLVVKVDVEANDPDGDKIRYRYRWFKNGLRQRLDRSMRQIAAERTHRNDLWRVEVRADDGESLGRVTSAEVKIVNTEPGGLKVAIEPKKPRGGSALTCAIAKPAKDVDGDALVYRFFWKLDGKAVGVGVDGQVDAALVHKGQGWSCQAEATDLQLTGPRSKAAEARVGNTPPSKPSVVITPTTPSASEEIRCALAQESTDVDGDALAYTFEWRKLRKRGKKSGKAMFEGQRRLAPGTLKKGETWLCRARASDGQETGSWASAEVEVRNSAPTAPVVHLEPESPVAGVDDLRCVIDTEASDPDGDRVRYRITWLKDGVVQDLAPTSQEVSARQITGSSLWQCAVEANDGPSSSAQVFSNTVLVGAAASAR